MNNQYSLVVVVRSNPKIPLKAIKYPMIKVHLTPMYLYAAPERPSTRIAARLLEIELAYIFPLIYFISKLSKNEQKLDEIQTIDMHTRLMICTLF